METHPPLADQFAGLRAIPTTPNADTTILSAALHALFAALFARIFDRLERILLLWQTGQLPPPQTNCIPSPNPHPDSTRKSHARQNVAPRSKYDARRPAPPPRATTPRILTHRAPPAPRPTARARRHRTINPVRRSHDARAPPAFCRPKLKNPPPQVAKPRLINYDIVLISHKALRTAPLGLNRRPRHRKPNLLRGMQQRMRQCGILDLGRLPTAPADQKLRRMVMPIRMFMRINTSNKRAQPLNPMHEPLRQQKLQRPINRRRRRSPTMPPQPLQQIISPSRRLGIQHQAKHQPPQLGQPRPAPLAQRSGVDQLGDRGGGEFRRHPCNVALMNNTSILAALAFDANGLIPAIAQQHDTGEVLMMAWMSRESIAETLTTGQVCYFSRSRNKLWRKGETSGQQQNLIELRLDCDGDTILLLVDQQGVACHTGRRDCFYRAARDGALIEIADPLISPDKLYGHSQ